MFPSPCGDYGSYHKIGKQWFLYAKYQAFPSPCGDYGSYLENETVEYVSDLFRFRPLAGIMVLIAKALNQKLHELRVSFRPLAGIMVLIVLRELLRLQGLYGVVSVPLRGLWFLSAPFINAFMKPSKWHFAGRIIYFHHFLSFAGK